MPLLDSFRVDHTRMKSPAVRLAKKIDQDGFIVTVWDLRFCMPNKEIMSVRGTHTLEHLYAGFMRQHLKGFTIIDISPMGCRTGFYMSVIGAPEDQKIVEAWTASMQDVLTVKSMADIPELNEYQCGTFSMHSLNEAQAIARRVLAQGIKTNANAELTLSDERIAAAYKPAEETATQIDAEAAAFLAAAPSLAVMQEKFSAEQLSALIRTMAQGQLHTA